MFNELLSNFSFAYWLCYPSFPFRFFKTCNATNNLVFPSVYLIVILFLTVLVALSMFSGSLNALSLLLNLNASDYFTRITGSSITFNLVDWWIGYLLVKWRLEREIGAVRLWKYYCIGLNRIHSRFSLYRLHIYLRRI